MKRLFIMRHGEASWAAASDQQRELTENGRNQVAVVAEWLQAQAIQPEVFASPYVRTQQTAKIVMDCNPGWQFKSLELITPSADIHQLIDFLATRKADDVMLVTHQPLVSRLSGLLLDNNPASGSVSFATACLAVLETDGLAGCANLQVFISPDALC